MKKALQKIVPLSMFLLLMLYACQQDSSEGLKPNQPLESLTIQDAKAWYNENLSFKPRLRSSDESGMNATLQPEWNIAEINADTSWYVVESPLEFTGDIQMRMMTESTAEALKTEKERQNAQQIIRMVVMRNRKTGDTYGFMMIVLPEWEYMQRKGNSLKENKYLSHDSDLDGCVFFYNMDGSFINGWEYNNGNVTGAIAPSEEDNNNSDGKISLRKSYLMMQETEWYQSVGTGGDWTYIGTTTRWDVVTVFEPDDFGREYQGNVNIDGIYTNSGGSGGGGAQVGPGQAATKYPQRRTDCPDKAGKNSTNVNNAINTNRDVLLKANTLKEYANTKNVEWGMNIDYNGGKYVIGNKGLTEGNDSYTSSNFNNSTVLTMHSHHKSDSEEKINFTGPSGDDIYNVLRINATISNNTSTNRYQGAVIYDYNGDSYLISVDNPAQAKEFFKTSGKAFQNTSTSAGSFKLEQLAQDYKIIRDKLEKDGFSKQDAHDYTTTYLLDKYKTGLKISKTSVGAPRYFGEMKTEYDTKTKIYQPKICL